ncbi:MAG TPA: hypothetical protein VLT47_02595 [Anaeromyxobacteraceae bacterium]|nr:hypothetical protein [Anaeromyxobacteraceae bacterium]
MNAAHVALVVAAALASMPAVAAPPAGAKPKRLAPADPAPASIAVPVEEEARIVGSCALGGGACADYQGAFAGVDVQALCAKAKGTWSASACPSENSVGTCTQRQNGTEDRIVTRTYAPSTVDAARKACVSSPRGMFLKAK